MSWSEVDPKTRIMTSIQIQDGGCWIWKKALDPDGYGRANAGPGRGMVLAHRWSYEIFVAPIPDGLQIDHLCRVRACVAPLHLEAVTAAENVRRSIEARKAS